MLFLNLLLILSFQSPESQTTHTDLVYVEIGPSTTVASQENFLLPLCDDIKVAGKQINFRACSKRPFPEWHSTERDSS